MKLLLKQSLMRKVLIALIPLQCLGVAYFGWRTLLLLIINLIIAFITEWLFVRKTNGKVSEAVFVTAMLFTLTLPPNIPFWISAIGIIFGVLFGKMVFGGFGKNPFNPALVGRAFIYVNFPSFMTTMWVKPNGFMNGLNHYQLDTVTQATPMSMFKTDGIVTPISQLLIGNTSGSIGETSAIAIILIALILLIKKVISKDIFWSAIIGFLGFSTLLYIFNTGSFLDPLTGLLSGGILFGATFMATDPISAPKTIWAKRLYGLLIGIITVIIRSFALFAGGVMFAILIANTFAPLMDEVLQSLQKPKVKKEASNG